MTRSGPPARPLVRRFGAALLTTGLLLTASPTVGAEAAFDLAETGVTQPVGMATDHHRERYWVVANNPGALLTLHALDGEGRYEGRMRSRDAVRNVQAIAFVFDQMFVGDVGGNRETVTIYVVTSPWPATEINHARQIKLTYPDGAHDSAAIFVDADARIHVVTRSKPAAIYAAPAQPSESDPNQLERVADAPEGVRDASVLLDGRVALRTADQVYLLDPDDWDVVAEVPIDGPQRGMSLTESLGQHVLLTAADAEGAVVEIAVPGRDTPEPSPTLTRAPVQVVPADPGDTRTFQQTGTVVAVVAALVVALASAAVVLVKR